MVIIHSIYFYIGAPGLPGSPGSPSYNKPSSYPSGPGNLIEIAIPNWVNMDKYLIETKYFSILI